MKLVLDASVAASWLLKRIDPREIAIADRAIEAVQRQGAKVPSIWPTEVANTLLTAERKGISTPVASTKFLADLATLDVQLEPIDLTAAHRNTVNLARSQQLTAYDATYLELALRTGSSLATFDRQLADAFRNLGGHVFGDLP
jgi:predicted nucleic acid-binding protein